MFTTEPRELWANGQGTGRYEPRGPDSWEFAFDLELFTFVTGGGWNETLGKATPIEYNATINWSSYNDLRLRGKTLRDPSFEKIRQLLT